MILACIMLKSKSFLRVLIITCLYYIGKMIDLLRDALSLLQHIPSYRMTLPFVTNSISEIDQVTISWIRVYK